MLFVRAEREPLLQNHLGRKRPIRSSLQPSCNSTKSTTKACPQAPSCNVNYQMVATARFACINSNAQVPRGTIIVRCSFVAAGNVLIQKQIVVLMFVECLQDPCIVSADTNSSLVRGGFSFRRCFPAFYIIHFLFFSVMYDVVGEGSSPVVAEVFSTDSSSVTAAL